MLPTKSSVDHMETRPRLRALYDRLEEPEIELRTPGCKASGLHIHYNMPTIHGYLHLHLIHAGIQEFLQGGFRPDCWKSALTTFFFSPQLNFQRFLRGTNIFQGMGGPTLSRGV